MVLKSNPKDYLIVALDISSEKEALKLVKDLKEFVSFFKIGLELFIKSGPEIIKNVKKEGASVFLDCKFLDIPNQVKGAVSNLVRHKVDMFTVHLTGGLQMLADSKKALEETSRESGIRKPKMLGVTVLTSISKEVLKDDLKVNSELREYVLHRAKFAYDAGLDGIVCSPNEASDVRKVTSNDFIIVTPGIRPSWAEKNDQRRTATPKDAIKNGASYIVVGRPIIKAENPKDAVKKVLDEIKEALK